MRYPGFIGGSATQHSSTFSSERTVNWYVERADTGGAKNAGYLLPTPGVATFATHATQAPVRALWAQADKCFAVIGTDFVEVGSGGTLTSRGTVSVDVGTDPATITSNGDAGSEILITSNGRAYVYLLADKPYPATAEDTVTAPAGTFQDLMGVHIPYGDLLNADLETAGLTVTATMGAMSDGYFLILDATTSTLWLSELADGTKWDPLQFQQRSLAPDPWVGLAVVGRDIWLLGQETSEVWYNAGTYPFPFAPHPQGVVPFGLAARWSAVPVGDSLIWLAKTRDGQSQIVQSRGLSAAPISTKALEFALASYSTITDAVAFTYEELGHTFYCLSFPTAKATWAYDLTTGLWCERGTWISESNEYHAWRPAYHAFAFGKHLVGDRTLGVLYDLSSLHQTDVESREIRRVRRAPVINDEGKRLFISRFQLDLEPGLGTPTGQGADPQVTLRYSNDAGKTWNTAGQRSAGSGALGQYQQRVIWTRLGSARNRVFEVVCSDPAPFRVSDAWLDLRPSGSR